MFLIAHRFAELRSWSQADGGSSHCSLSQAREISTCVSWSRSGRSLRWQSVCGSRTASTSRSGEEPGETPSE